MTPSPPKELEIQGKIFNNLVELGIFCFRNNSGAFAGEYKGKKRFVQFGLPGSSDLIAIVKGIFVGVEVKRPGGKQSDYQKAFQRNVEEAGGAYILAYSWNDVVPIINQILKSK